MAHSIPNLDIPLFILIYFKQLLKSEHHRHSIFLLELSTVLHSGFPLRHRTDHTDSFFIQIRINPSYHFRIRYRPVLIYNKLNNNLSFVSRFPCEIVGYLILPLKYFIKAAVPPGNSGIISTLT